MMRLRINKKARKILRIVQHILVGAIAFILLYTFTGSSIVLSGYGGDYSYNLYESDKSRTFEDSYLFNNILGNNTANVFKLVSERTQMESDGNYDGEKTIDVTAYINRGSVLPGDYVTAVYYLSDILKWGQSGVSFETREFTDAQSNNFLSDSTTYTHLSNNVVSGGMNSYLSSQIDNNSKKFSISGNSSPEGGTHNILISRYQTVDGKNIEDIVSTWEEYDLLCSYVKETVEDFSKGFKEYGELLDYYSYFNSNLRYYISRTINGKKESYTNIPEITAKYSKDDISEVFNGYGRFIYYCPYELKYLTNTQLSENVIKSMVKSYEYVFPDQIKIFIGVDTVNYPCIDEFTQGKNSFSKFMPYRSQLIIISVILAVLYILIFFIQTRKMAYEYEGETVIGENKIPNSETAIVSGLIIMAVPVLIIVALKLSLNMNYIKLFQYRFAPYAAFLLFFVFDIGFLHLIYETISRIQNGVFWNQSLIKKLMVASQNAIISATDHSNVVVRTWIPYMAFILLNVLLYKIGAVGISLLVILDILVGIYLLKQNIDRDKIIKVIENIKSGDVKDKVDTRSLHADNVKLAEAVNSIGEGIEKAVSTSMKDEKLKADLITNVSHDIKTPLTSIINYVGLIKRENIDDPKIREYVDVLDEKSNRLKQLTEDLLEASKISSGNINITFMNINFVEMINQMLGEFYEKFEEKKLQTIFRPSKPNIQISADPRHLWRVIENLFNNICKYAMPGTRVYMDMKIKENADKKTVALLIRNISKNEIDVDAEDLTERFIRGDESRTTEGSGLGLSIAKNLTVAQGGEFSVKLDGDLFKVIIEFPEAGKAQD